MLAVLLWRGSARPGWSPRHVLVLAASPLLLSALLSYAVDPTAPMNTKIIPSTVVPAGIIVLLAGANLLAGRRSADLEHDLADHPA